MKSVWRLNFYDDECGLFASLESAQRYAHLAAYGAHGFTGQPGPKEWKKDGLDTWRSVDVKGFTIDECEVHP